MSLGPSDDPDEAAGNRVGLHVVVRVVGVLGGRIVDGDRGRLVVGLRRRADGDAAAGRESVVAAASVERRGATGEAVMVRHLARGVAVRLDTRLDADEE